MKEKLVNWIPTEQKIANIMTKLLLLEAHKYLKNKDV